MRIGWEQAFSMNTFICVHIHTYIEPCEDNSFLICLCLSNRDWNPISVYTKERPQIKRWDTTPHKCGLKLPPSKIRIFLAQSNL